MDDIVFEALERYFKTLSTFGYKKYKDVDKMLALIAIDEFIYNDFYGLVTEDDYREIEKALYCLFGSTCLIPWPSYCNKKEMNKLHLGDITELAYLIKRNKKAIEDNYTTLDTKIDTEVLRLDGRIDSLDIKIDTINTNLNTRIDTLIANLKNEILDILVGNNQDLRNDLLNNTTTIHQLIQSAQDLAISTSNNYTNTEINKLDKSIRDYIDNCCNEVHTTVNNTVDLVNKLNSAVTKLKDEYATVTNYANRLRDINSSIQVISNKYDSLYNTVVNNTNAIAHNTHSIDNILKILSLYDTKFTAIDNDIDGINITITTINNDVTNLKDKDEALDRKLSDLEDKVEGMDKDLDSMKNDIQDIKDELSVASSNVNISSMTLGFVPMGGFRDGNDAPYIGDNALVFSDDSNEDMQGKFTLSIYPYNYTPSIANITWNVTVGGSLVSMSTTDNVSMLTKTGVPTSTTPQTVTVNVTDSNSGTTTSKTIQVYRGAYVRTKSSYVGQTSYRKGKADPSSSYVFEKGIDDIDLWYDYDATKDIYDFHTYNPYSGSTINYVSTQESNGVYMITPKIQKEGSTIKEFDNISAVYLYYVEDILFFRQQESPEMYFSSIDAYTDLSGYGRLETQIVAKTYDDTYLETNKNETVEDVNFNPSRSELTYSAQNTKTVVLPVTFGGISKNLEVNIVVPSVISTTYYEYDYYTENWTSGDDIIMCKYSFVHPYKMSYYLRTTITNGKYYITCGGDNLTASGTTIKSFLRENLRLGTQEVGSSSLYKLPLTYSDISINGNDITIDYVPVIHSSFMPRIYYCADSTNFKLCDSDKNTSVATPVSISFINAGLVFDTVASVSTDNLSNVSIDLILRCVNNDYESDTINIPNPYSTSVYDNTLFGYFMSNIATNNITLSNDQYYTITSQNVSYNGDNYIKASIVLSPTSTIKNLSTSKTVIFSAKLSDISTTIRIYIDVLSVPERIMRYTNDTPVETILADVHEYTKDAPSVPATLQIQKVNRINVPDTARVFVLNQGGWLGAVLDGPANIFDINNVLIEGVDDSLSAESSVEFPHNLSNNFIFSLDKTKYDIYPLKISVELLLKTKCSIFDTTLPGYSTSVMSKVSEVLKSKNFYSNLGVFIGMPCNNGPSQTQFKDYTFFPLFRNIGSGIHKATMKFTGFPENPHYSLTMINSMQSKTIDLIDTSYISRPSKPYATIEIIDADDHIVDVNQVLPQWIVTIDSNEISDEYGSNLFTEKNTHSDDPYYLISIDNCILFDRISPSGYNLIKNITIRIYEEYRVYLDDWSSFFRRFYIDFV